jgi:TPR repeat protein
MNEFGMACKEGTGVAVDRAQAEWWFRKAAEVEPDAIYNLAMLHIEDGEVVKGVKVRCV